MLSMDLVKELNSCRLENKITQQALAEHLGVSFITVNRWFNGKTHPSKIQAYHIEKFLKARKQK
jgi:transcriptional regulator with XRE-family HTH domain